LWSAVAGIKSIVVAVGAAPYSNATIAIWTGKTSINSKLLDSTTKLPFEVVGVTIISTGIAPWVNTCHNLIELALKIEKPLLAKKAGKAGL
jgi:hypothetical protein